MHIGPGGSADQVASGRLHIRAHLHAVGELDRAIRNIVGILALIDDVIGHQILRNIHLHLTLAAGELADCDAQVFQSSLSLGIRATECDYSAVFHIVRAVLSIDRITCVNIPHRICSIRLQVIDFGLTFDDLVIALTVLGDLIAGYTQCHLAGKLHTLTQRFKIGDLVASADSFARAGTTGDGCNCIDNFFKNCVQIIR